MFGEFEEEMICFFFAIKMMSERSSSKGWLRFFSSTNGDLKKMEGKRGYVNAWDENKDVLFISRVIFNVPLYNFYLFGLTVANDKYET